MKKNYDLINNFPGLLKITDKRDIKEIKRRINVKTFQPNRDELYSVNPEFDGKYTD
jgi:hypothetical protein